MADDVTNIGDGWDGVPQGSAEYALMQILKAGQLTGDAVAQELIAEGFAARGPVYYPRENDKGPFYALGLPHTYVSIEQGPNGTQWNLTRAEPGDLPVTQPPSTTPAPLPIGADLDRLELDDISQRLAELQNSAATKDDVSAARDAVVERITSAQEAIQQQIDQVVKNAESTMKAIEPIVEAALPALAGLFGKS